MAESIAEQIAEALVSSLSGIVGDNGAAYWYTPDTVVRVSYFPNQWLPAPEVGRVQYVLSPGSESVIEETTSNGAKAEAEFILQLCYLLDAATENPYEQIALTRWTVVNRMVRDAVKRLLSNVTLTGLVGNVVSDSISIDREQYSPRWAMAQLRFTVEYPFQADTP